MTAARGDAKSYPVAGPRVLHIINRMDRGGVETWLMNVQRALTESDWHTAYLTHDHRPGVFDAEILELGGGIVRGPNPARPISYVRALKNLLEAEGPFDVVHSHVGLFSAFVLLAANRARVPRRIAHAHNAELTRRGRLTRGRFLYVILTRALIRRYATQLFATSAMAASSLLGADWARDERMSVLPYGIDLARLSSQDLVTRQDLGLPGASFVIGHVGSFRPEKNYDFILDVLEEVLKEQNHVLLLLIGDGPLRDSVEQAVEDRGLAPYVRFLGLCNDVPGILAGAVDVLLFPSTSEGLGLVVVEAQASGVSCVCSNRVPSEAVIIPELVSVLDLAEPRGRWVDALFEMAGRRLPRVEAQLLAEETDISMDHCIARLRDAYLGT